MKILEEKPEIYDKGIKAISGGKLAEIREEIIRSFVNPSCRMLDIGCGTGELLIQAASAGAEVVGIDISDKMLSFARDRAEVNNLADKVRLERAGVTEIDSLFEENSFDLITSILVFSELYSEERKWALREIRRLLKESGIFILVDEFKPSRREMKFLYSLLRLPMEIITYILSGSRTEPLQNIKNEIRKAELEILEEKRWFLGSLGMISSCKNNVLR